MPITSHPQYNIRFSVGLLVVKSLGFVRLFENIFIFVSYLKAVLGIEF